MEATKKNEKMQVRDRKIDIFGKSQLKESDIVMGVCCSRHLQCIHTGNDPTRY